MHSSWRAFWFGPVHQEDEGDEEQEEAGEKAKYGVVGEHAGLLFDHSKDKFAGLMCGGNCVSSPTHEHVFQGAEHLSCTGAIGIHVLAENVDVGLLTAQLDGVDGRDADAAA